MGISIYGGERHDVRWCTRTKTFKPASEVESGPIFTYETLDFYAWQDVLEARSQTKSLARAVLEAGLKAIDGDSATVAKFIERPGARLGEALFSLIWDGAQGN